MSASLVGSEMCIRDRQRSWHAPVRSSKALARGGARGKRWARRAEVPQWPVSYTHLTLPTICSV
eukprot:14226332-Alexandrium_andersonii.AAC.1